MPSFSAVVLAGGQSTRMGRDKAMLPLPGSNLLLWQRQVHILEELQPEEIFWSGPARPGMGDHLRLVSDKIENAGPLAGISACLDILKSDLLVVLAIDLPRMNAGFLKQLLDRCSAECGAVACHGDFFEPLAAIYPKGMHVLAIEHLRQKRYSLQDFIRETIQQKLMNDFPLDEGDAPLFKNLNLPSDVEDTPHLGVEEPEKNLTEVVLSKVKPGMDGRYREWAIRIQNAQAKYPGYRGMYLQPPATQEGRWASLIRYDTAEHLEAWIAAPERAALLAEAKAFIENEELTRLATSFPGWVPIDLATGNGPPDWKTALLVLLGLFPIVVLEMKYVAPILYAFGLHPVAVTFIGTIITVGGTTFATMPIFVRFFGWWLFPKKNGTATSFKGCIILLALFTIEIGTLWLLLPG